MTQEEMDRCVALALEAWPDIDGISAERQIAAIVHDVIAHDPHAGPPRRDKTRDAEAIENELRSYRPARALTPEETARARASAARFLAREDSTHPNDPCFAVCSAVDAEIYHEHGPWSRED